MAQALIIEVKGIQKLNSVFSRLPRVVQHEVKNELRAIGEEWVGKAKSDAPVDRARLKGSISYNLHDLNLEIIAQNEIAPYQEFGTKRQFKAHRSLGNYPDQFRGSSSSNVNPIVALTDWVRRKGIGDGKNDKSVAYLIFRKIKREGIKPHPFLFSGRDGSDRLTYFFNKVRKNIAAVLREIV